MRATYKLEALIENSGVPSSWQELVQLLLALGAVQNGAVADCPRGPFSKE